MGKFWFGTGCLMAGLGVSAGAFGTHALKQHFSADLLVIFETGVRYQMYHALGLIAVGLAMDRWPCRTLHWTARFWLIGIVLFSGTLYMICLTNIQALGTVAPFGGACFLVGWILLLWEFLVRPKVMSL